MKYVLLSLKAGVCANKWLNLQEQFNGIHRKFENLRIWFISVKNEPVGFHIKILCTLHIKLLPWTNANLILQLPPLMPLLLTSLTFSLYQYELTLNVGGSFQFTSFYSEFKCKKKSRVKFKFHMKIFSEIFTNSFAYKMKCILICFFLLVLLNFIHSQVD